MTSFRLALFGYRRIEVDAAVTARDSHIAGLEQHAAALTEHQQSLEAQSLIQARAIASHEADVSSLSGMVIERERTIRDLTERLEEANACHDRSIASLDAVSARLEDLQAQARGQATRIRMKALREAVELQQGAGAAGAEPAPPRPRPSRRSPPKWPSGRRSDANGSTNGHATATATPPSRPLRGPGSTASPPRDRPAGRFLPAGRRRGRGRPARRHRHLGRTLLRGPRDLLDAARAANRPPARTGGPRRPRLQGPPHRPGQPDPRLDEDEAPSATPPRHAAPHSR